MITTVEALERLKAGNRRFMSATLEHCRTSVLLDRRDELIEGQAPFAVILGCSDSRVPAEIIFDQGLGDLFVIRVAGNIVASSQIGSVEFAVERFGTPLVVVLGHSRCGAVAAAVEALACPEERLSSNLHSIIDRITPTVEAVREAGEGADPDELLRQAVRWNIRTSVRQLHDASPSLQGLIQRHALAILGAEYYVETGEVAFFDDLPNTEGALK